MEILHQRCPILISNLSLKIYFRIILKNNIQLMILEEGKASRILIRLLKERFKKMDMKKILLFKN